MKRPDKQTAVFGDWSIYPVKVKTKEMYKALKGDATVMARSYRELIDLLEKLDA